MEKRTVVIRGALSLGVVAVFALLAAGSYDSDSGDSSSAGSGEPKKTEWAVGEPLTSPELELTVTKVEFSRSIKAGFWDEQPAEGGIFVAVQYGYKNIGKKPRSTWDEPDVDLISPDGVEYSADLDAAMAYAAALDNDSKVLSDLNPGIAVKDTAVYEVSTELLKAPGWKLQIEFDGKTFAVPVNWEV